MVLGRGWKSSEVLAGESQGFHEWTIGTTKKVEGNSGESSERKEESWRESFCLLREHINNHEQNVCRNLDIKNHFGEVSDRREEQVIGNWRQDALVIKWQRMWLDSGPVFYER